MVLSSASVVITSNSSDVIEQNGQSEYWYTTTCLRISKKIIITKSVKNWIKLNLRIINKHLTGESYTIMGVIVVRTN